MGEAELVGQRDPVAPPFAFVVDPHLGDAAEEGATVARGEELRDALAPGLEPRPLHVAEAHAAVSHLQQFRETAKSVIRALELRRVDNEAVAYPQRFEQLALVEGRCSHPPEIRRHPADEQGIDKRVEVIRGRSADM